jgi:hypothetical protein
MAGLTHDYLGFANRTARPVTGRSKARRKSDWAWKPYGFLGQQNGRITVTTMVPKGNGMAVIKRSYAPKRAKLEARG